MAVLSARRRPNATNPVCLDAWALIALGDPDDQWHSRAVAISTELTAAKRRQVVTDWVLAEFLAHEADPTRRQYAVQSVNRLRGARSVRIVTATHKDWERGFALYTARADKSWSLVDCISILVCQRLRITDVFTGDHHFEQTGLKILLR